MKYYFINHGYMGSNTENWFPWLKEKIEESGNLCVIPQYPIGMKHHFYHDWATLLDAYKTYGMINEDTTMIGHSTGAIFTVKYLLENKIKIDKLILVSGFNNFYSDDKNDFHNEVHKTCFLGSNKLKELKKYVNNIICIFGDNDPYIPQSILRDFAQNLGASEVIINGGAHLNKEAGYTTFEEILKYI